MFDQQKFIIEQAPSVKDMAVKYQQPTTMIEEIYNGSKSFCVRFPLIGAFSSGKSSLLNALIDDNVFAISIDPQTAVPAELSYSPVTEFIGHLQSGETIKLTPDMVKLHQLSSLQPNGWFEALLQKPVLKQFPHVRIVDMPGWESGNEGHARAIDNYASRSLAYGVVVSADEGNLRESLRIALKELTVMNMPIIGIVTKSERKLPEDVQAVIELVEQEIASAIGQKPLSVIAVSARTKNISKFIDVLMLIEQRSESIYAQKYAADFVFQISQILRHIDVLLNKEDLDSEKIFLKIDELHQQKYLFEEKINYETKILESHADSVLRKIMQRVENQLKGSVGGLATTLINKGDVASSMLNTIRISVAEGVRNEFEPEMQRYFSKLDQVLPSSIDIKIDQSQFSNLTTNSKDDTFTDKLKGGTWGGMFAELLTVIVPSLTKIIPGPVGMIIGTILGVLFTGSSKNDQMVARTEQLEQAKQQLMSTVIPQVCGQVQATLEPALLDRIESAKKQISQTAADQFELIEQSLMTLQQNLQQSQSEFQRSRDEYAKDKKYLSEMQTKLESFV